MTDQKTFALYCRVSTNDQNPDAQRIALEEFCRRQGFKFVVFEEVESTRKTRPIKAALLNRLRAFEFDGVIVWQLSRWARSSSELALEVTELHNKNIAFISLKENIDLSTATGKLMFQVIAAFAEFEREIIRERTLLGLKAALAKGKKLGRPTGAVDKTARRKSGYHLRWAGKVSVKNTPLENARVLPQEILK